MLRTVTILLCLLKNRKAIFLVIFYSYTDAHRLVPVQLGGNKFDLKQVIAFSGLSTGRVKYLFNLSIRLFEKVGKGKKNLTFDFINLILFLLDVCT